MKKNYLLIITFILTFNLVAQQSNDEASKTRHSNELTKCYLQKFMDFLTFYAKMSSLNCNFMQIVQRLSFTECQDPPIDVLKEKRFKLQNLFNEGIRVLDIPVLNRLIKNITIQSDVNTDEALIYGNKECNITEFKEQHDRGLCPWHYVTVYRDNRFPKLQTMAKCNCKDCQILEQLDDDIKYSCKPYKTLSPVLVRGDCKDGVFEWKPMFEYVSTACLCLRDDTDKIIE